MYRTSDDLAQKSKTHPAIPKPRGFQVLIAVPDPEEKTKGGVIMPDQLIEREKTASIVGCVVGMGPDAYGDKGKFPSGPYCAIGEWVVFRSYSGLKVHVEGVEYRLVNDDTVLAGVTDPRELVRS